MDLRIQGFKDSWIHGVVDLKSHGFMESRINGFKDSMSSSEVYSHKGIMVH